MGKRGKIGVSASKPGLMTPDEYREAIAAAGYSQERFAVLVGASPRTGQKWALGETRVPGCVALMLRLLTARPELRSVVDGMVPPPTRARAVKRAAKRSRP